MAFVRVLEQGLGSVSHIMLELNVLSENKDAHNPQNAYSVRLSETKIWSTFLSVLSELKRSAQRTVRPIENYFRPLSVYLLSMK